MIKAINTSIIPRREHNVSRKQLSRNALFALYRLRDHGYISYLVGGCVRDILLSRTPKDFDIATNATPEQIKKLFRNCRLIGRRFRLAHLQFRDETIEVSTFRSAAPSEDDGTGEPDRHGGPIRHLKDKDGMVLRDNIFGTPMEDALRRDFTINALAYNIADCSVIDVTNGIADLRQRIIRPIGYPVVRFTEDPVRMIRAVRFAATLDFTIERETWETLCTNASTVTRAAPARLYEEVLKLFLLGSARPIFMLMDKSGLLAALFPWLNRWLHEHTGASAIIHAMLERIDTLVREGMAPSPALLLAALFGPSLEERAILVHRTGIPHQQALNALYNTFFEELCKTVTVPAKIGNRLRTILIMQSSLHKVPPRRPQGIVGRQNFDDALSYMRMMTEITGENIPARNWWDAFMNGQPPETIAVPAGVEPPPKQKRRRRRRKRRPAEIQN